MFRLDFTCPALLEDLKSNLPVRGYHPLLLTFPDHSSFTSKATGLFHFRSPLLAESQLMSFPPGTKMFQFPGFASQTYVFSLGYRFRGGFPHSEISGSTVVCTSPKLIAAYHVLHRLSMPRHSSNALKRLISCFVPKYETLYLADAT